MEPRTKKSTDSSWTNTDWEPVQQMVQPSPTVMDAQPDLSEAFKNIIHPAPRPVPSAVTVVPDDTPSSAPWIVWAFLILCRAAAILTVILGVLCLFAQFWVGVFLITFGSAATYGFDRLASDVDKKRKPQPKHPSRLPYLTADELLRRSESSYVPSYSYRSQPVEDPKTAAINALAQIELKRIDVPLQEKEIESRVTIAEIEKDKAIETTRLTAEATKGSAKYNAMGLMGSRTMQQEMEKELKQFEHDLREESADKQRRHELERDKQTQDHEWRKLLERLDREMAMWREKIEVDHKARPEEVRETMAAWDMVEAARDRIRQRVKDGELDDDDMMAQTKAFEKFFYSVIK